MFAAYGTALTRSAVIFVSQSGLANGLAKKLRVEKELVAVENVRGGISKANMLHNSATPKIEVDPETYRVTADGALLVCEPAKELPMAQRYFLF
jgi:urease subunit alpha